MANAKRCAMMRAKHEEAYQELHEAIKFMNERQGKLLVTMKRTQKLMSEAPEALRGKMLQEIRDSDERISGEEIALLEKKQVMQEMWKERRSTEFGGRRDTVVVGIGVTWMAVACSRSSKTEGHLLLSEVGVLQKDMEEDQRSFWSRQGAAAEKKSSGAGRVAETRLCLSTPTDKPLGGRVEAEKRGRNVGAELHPEWCREKSFKFFKIAATGSEEGGAAHTLNLCKSVITKGD